MSLNSSDLKNLNQSSPFIELYTLDGSGFGGSTYRFTNYGLSGTTVSFGGVAYTVFPVTASGFDYLSGQNPQPKLTVANVLRTLITEIINFGDLVGYKVIRRRTFAKHLDGAANADSTKYLEDVFYIEQKTAQNSSSIEFLLSSAYDLGGRKFGRVIRANDFPGIKLSKG